MTSRERILAALNHRESDRVPIDLSGHRSSGISAIAYVKLRDYLGLEKKPIRVYDPVQQLAIVDDDVLTRFNVDTIELGRGFALDDDCWVNWTLPDGTPCLMPYWCRPQRGDGQWLMQADDGTVVARMPDGGLYFEQVYYPFAENADLDRMTDVLEDCMWVGCAAPPGPLVGGPDGQDKLRRGAEKLRQQTDKAVLGLFGGNLLELGQFLWRNDNFLFLLAADPKTAHDFLDRATEMHLRNLENFLKTVGSHIDIIVFGDDLGMQRGPQISPQMYREFFKPRHQMLWNKAKELANVKVLLHCCGGVRELLPDLIEAGLDAINPVQISCRGMDAGELKKEFGKDLVFWGGGCDTQRILPQATPQEVADHVRRQVDILRPGGGFVFQQVHNIQANVPPANIVAMFDAVNAS